MATGLEPADGLSPRAIIVRMGDHVETGASLRGAPGPVVLRRYRFEGAESPANFVCYEIPPGAAEGEHVHYADDRNGTGAYDEIYFILSGEGVMTVGPESFVVGPGDAVHVPMGLPRGIRNEGATGVLRVHLTFISRPPRAD